MGKSLISTFIGIIIVFILLMTWFYPYSSVSIHKSFTFTPDHVVVNGYVNKLNAFKKSYDKQSGFNITTDRTQYILKMFEQDWLVEGKPVKMGKSEMNAILINVKNAREILLHLVSEGNYTKEQRQYLVGSIDSFLYLEDAIREIQSNTNLSRGQIDNEFHNLYMSFFSSFNAYRTFYEVAQ